MEAEAVQELAKSNRLALKLALAFMAGALLAGGGMYAYTSNSAPKVAANPTPTPTATKSATPSPSATPVPDDALLRQTAAAICAARPTIDPSKTVITVGLIKDNFAEVTYTCGGELDGARHIYKKVNGMWLQITSAPAEISDHDRKMYGIPNDFK